MSGAEVAFFSLSPTHQKKVRHMTTKSSHRIRTLIGKPEKLLATILISNNFINVGIVIITTYISSSIFDFREEPIWGFIIQVVTVTFLLLIFGEIIPKIYASRFPLRFSLFMSMPLSFLDKVFTPLSNFMIYSTSFVNRKISSKKTNLSMGDLSEALELTTGVVHEEKRILKSIVKFSNLEVNEIMKPRMDVVAIDISTNMAELIKIINSSGYNRIPVFEGTLDNLKGILYAKDLLPFIDKVSNFDWQSLIRPSYFVPGAKKINVLLQEFREKKIHLAIVVDEYGGTEGIVSLEDILEEIIGEITDESDEVERFYTRIDEKSYIFDAKVLLNDFYKTLHITEDIFEKEKGDSDTLAGLILEVLGEIPSVNKKIKIGRFTFTILQVDSRKINKVKIDIGA